MQYGQPQPFASLQSTRSGPVPLANRQDRISPPRIRTRNASSSDIPRDPRDVAMGQRPTSPPTSRYPQRPESPLSVPATYIAPPQPKIFTPPPPPPPIPPRANNRPPLNVEDYSSPQETMTLTPLSTSWDSRDSNKWEAQMRQPSADHPPNRRFPPVDVVAAARSLKENTLSPQVHPRLTRPSTAPYSPSEAEPSMTLQRPQTGNPTPTQLHSGSMTPSRSAMGSAISSPGYLPPGAAPPVQRYPADFRMESRPSANKLSSIYIDRAVLDKQPGSTSTTSLARGRHKSDFSLGTRYLRENPAPLPVIDSQSPTTPSASRRNGHNASPSESTPTSRYPQSASSSSTVSVSTPSLRGAQSPLGRPSRRISRGKQSGELGTRLPQLSSPIPPARTYTKPKDGEIDATLSPGTASSPSMTSPYSSARGLAYKLPIGPNSSNQSHESQTLLDPRRDRNFNKPAANGAASQPNSNTLSGRSSNDSDQDPTFTSPLPPEPQRAPPQPPNFKNTAQPPATSNASSARRRTVRMDESHKQNPESASEDESEYSGSSSSSDSDGPPVWVPSKKVPASPGPSVERGHPVLTVRTDIQRTQSSGAEDPPSGTPTPASAGTKTLMPALGRPSSFSDEEDEERWDNIRPRVEEVYDHLDRFFPGHDLDKPVIEAPGGTSPVVPEVNEPPAGAALRHKKKSIRVVAGEKRDLLRRSYMETQSSANAKLRRRSTKLWDSKVIEVQASELGSNPDSPSAPPVPQLPTKRACFF
jgi:hypothetical protein